jgi:RNA-binding motif X-linked protein 2
LPFDLSEGDVITIFSQFGEPVHINLVRDKETGKSKGFAFLKYEDQRSTDLAVDNLGGATILGRVLRVDHTRYKRKDDEDLGDNTEIRQSNGSASEDEESHSRRKRRRSNSQSDQESRPLLREERELAELLRNQDDDDPMKEYLVKEKREEVAIAIAEWKAEDLRSKRKEGRSKHRHRRHHRSRKDEYEERGLRSSKSQRSPSRSDSNDRDRGSRYLDRHTKGERRRRSS